MRDRTDLEFKPVQAEHVDLVIAMMRALEEEDPNKKPFDERSRRESCEQMMREPHLGRIWLIAKEGLPVGYVVLAYVFSFEYGGRDAFIDELYVCSRAPRNGNWPQRTGFCQERSEGALGLRTLHLEVSHANSGALKLYRGAHFADHDRYLLTKWLD